MRGGTMLVAPTCKVVPVYNFKPDRFKKPVEFKIEVILGIKE